MTAPTVDTWAVAAALLTPDAPELPAEPVVRRSWRGVTGPTWVEITDRLLLIVSKSGRVTSPPWSWLEVHHRFGPLREVPNA